MTAPLEVDQEGMVEILIDRAAALTRPPRSFDELLNALAKTVPGFVTAVRDFL
jgi:hypothetical protein